MLTTFPAVNLRMVLLGMKNVIPAQDLEKWENETNSFVRDFWKGIAYSPVSIGEVKTSFVAQKNTSTLPVPERFRRKLQVDMENTSGNSTILRLDITYNQNISYAVVGNLKIYGDEPGVLFLTPFELDPITYTNAMIALIKNNQSVFLESISFDAPPPDPSPTPAPNEKSSDSKAIIISVTVVFFVLTVAGGYIFYLVRRQDMNELEDVGPNTPVDVIRDGDAYYVQAMTPVEASPSASFSNRSGHSTTSETGYANHMSSSMELPDVEGEDTNFPNSTSAPMAVIEDPDSIVQSAASGSLATDQAQSPLEEEGGDPPHAFSMTGFQMEIEDLDDI